MLAIITPITNEGPLLGAQKAAEGESLTHLLHQAAQHVESLRGDHTGIIGADISYHAVGGPAVFKLRGERL